MRFNSLIALFAAVGLGMTANADTLNYQISSTSSVSAYTDGSAGLAIDTALAPDIANGTEQFTLDDSQSATFDFFKIWSDESTINSDDVMPVDITATVAFTAPAGTIVQVGGETVGSDATIQFFGHVIGTIGTGAEVSWDNLPIQVITSDRVFDLSLSDTTFNSLFGIYIPGEALAGTVEATVRQISGSGPSEASIAVPLPASTYGISVLSALLLAARFRRRVAHLTV